MSSAAFREAGRTFLTIHHTPATTAARTRSHARAMKNIIPDIPHIMSKAHLLRHCVRGTAGDVRVKPAVPFTLCGLPGVTLRVLVELLVAVGRTEIKRLAFVLGGRLGLLFVHLHATDRI